MEEKELDAREIIAKVKEYVDVRKEIAILSAVDKGSQLFANLVTDGLVLLFGVLGVLFGSLAAGFYLSEVFENTYAGFLIVTGFYFLLAIVFYALKDKYVEKHIINAAIKKFFRNKHEA
ncbi:MAG: phage holin family protein [Bacteroidota bacterium]